MCIQYYYCCCCTTATATATTTTATATTATTNNNISTIQGRSQDFTLEATEAERRSAESAESAERDGHWGGPPTNFGIFEAHRTFLVERSVPSKAVFFRKKIDSIDDWGHMAPCRPPLATPLVLLLSLSSCAGMMSFSHWHAHSLSYRDTPVDLAIVFFIY